MPQSSPSGKGRDGAAALLPRWGLLLALLVLLCLLHPRTWGHSGPSLWFPPAGLGLVVVAWLGVRFAFPVLLGSGLLVLVLTGLLSALGYRAVAPGELPLLAADVALTSLELVLAWWLYHDHAGGARHLSDPRSATQFLFLVPGVVAGVFALGRAALLRLVDVPVSPPFTDANFGQLLALCWLNRALGELILAPVLLVVVTPYLERLGLLAPELGARRGGSYNFSSVEGDLGTAQRPSTTRWGDWLETLGLAVGASVLCAFLTRVNGQREQLGWQLWGAPLLLIVWASLRQGLRGGGIVVAAAAAAVPLLFLPVRAYRPDSPLFALLLQGHLLAQCCAALLVASSIVWVRLRESSYRQVVAHVPVVIYSARFHHEGGLKPGNGAEVTLVSAASGTLLDCPPEQLLGDWAIWLQRVHPDDREVVQAALAQLARQEQPVTCEYRLAPLPSADCRAGASSANPQAKVRWLRDTLAPHRDANGNLTGWEGVVTDITEQRVLADDLRRTTGMFNALVVNLPTGIFFVQGPHGNPILVNARARHLLGQREDSSAPLEHLSRAYRLFRADGTLYPVEELPVYQALRHGRTTMRDDIVVHRPDGRHLPLVSWAAPVNLGGPQEAKAGAAVWVLEDRSALHQAEAARQDSEGRLRAVIETMGEGLIVQDRKGHIIEGNPAACALFGYPAGGLGGRSLFGLPWAFLREDGGPLPPEEHPAEVALRTGRPVRNVVLGLLGKEEGGTRKEEEEAPDASFFVPPSSLPRWLLVNAMPLGPIATPRWAAGVVTTFSDISAYVHAREVLRASEESYRNLVDSLPVMLIMADREGRVISCNPSTTKISGYELAEIADPDRWAALVVPEDLPRLQGLLTAALGGQSGRAEARYRAKDGSEKTAYVMTQPRYQNNAVVGTLSLLVDVTRERQLERELQRSQRLELIGRLASGVAHDFNNLLSVVLSLADLARGHLPADHQVHRDLQQITEAGEQAASLAGQLLALSKQPQPTRRARIELNRLVRRTLDLLRATLPLNVTLEATLANDDLFILGDELQVGQVVMNLCLNARDAMPRGGRIDVQTALEEHNGLCVRLSVRDTGVGISAQTKARIFEPFFTTKEGGTGLGLAVVQQIVESCGGRIEAHSEPGQGSSFEVWWPLFVGR